MVFIDVGERAHEGPLTEEKLKRIHKVLQVESLWLAPPPWWRREEGPVQGLVEPCWGEVRRQVVQSRRWLNHQTQKLAPPGLGTDMVPKKTRNVPLHVQRGGATPMQQSSRTLQKISHKKTPKPFETDERLQHASIVDRFDNDSAYSSKNISREELIVGTR